MKKKIIITGSSGFIGSSLVQYLYSKNYQDKYDFILIDRKKNPYGDKYSKNTTCYTIDIAKHLSSLHIKFVDTVIHLAATPSVRDSDKKIEQVINDNILGTSLIVKKCIEEWKPRRMILASSSSVYDGRDNSLMKESDQIRLLSPYAQTKLANEELIQMYINNGLLKCQNCALMRIFTVYGPRQRDELAIQAIIDSYLNNKKFYLHGTGEQRRDFTYIEDTCSAIEALMKAKNLSKDNPMYNIGTGENRSINEIIKLVGDILDKKLKISKDKPTRYDTMYTQANIDKINHYTKWKPCMKFEDGVKTQIEWQKKQMKK